MDPHPPAEFLGFLREKVESGKYPSEGAVGREAIRRLRDVDGARPATGESAIPDDPIDQDAIDYCAREVYGKDIPSLAEVRRISSKVAGSLSRAILEEREDRS